MGIAAGSQCTDLRKLPASIVSLNPKYHESYGCACIRGARDPSMPLWLAFTVSAPAERSVGNCSPAKVLNLDFSFFPDTYNKTTTYHTLVLGHSMCTRMLDYLHSGHNTHLCPDFKLSRTTSVEICGRGRLTVTRLMANGGALLNSIMCRVSKDPGIIFLHVGGNDFPRTARN